MDERRKHKRQIVKNGVFAVIAGNPYKIYDISRGGAAFHCATEQFVDEQSDMMEILVMDGEITYIRDIRHSFLKMSPRVTERYTKADTRVRVAFAELTMQQTAQFEVLLGAA